MTLSCAIIDDEPLDVGLLENYVEKTPFLELRGAFGSAIEAMATLRENPVQLLFLDIQMPELSGLELARILPAETRIIFTTAFSQYAIDGYRVNAFDYLLKPIDYKDFLAAAMRAHSWFSTQSEGCGRCETDESLFVKSDYRTVRVDRRHILYVEGLKDYIKIYTSDNPRPLLSLSTLKAIESSLPAERFMRVHRSYIVNMEQITAIERNQILIGGKEIPVSESCRDAVQAYVAGRLLQGR